MFSVRGLSARMARPSICAQCFRKSQPSRALTNSTTQVPSHPTKLLRNQRLQLTPVFLPRTFATKSTADEVIEDITDQYSIARDEFEIATEETEKKSVYAEADREAAREELDKLKEMFNEVLKGKNGEEVKGRIGQRIRELDHAVQALEQSALEE